MANMVVSLYAAKTGKELPRRGEDYLGPSPRRFYRFVADRAWLQGERLPEGQQLIDTKI